jgi:hypothetical protein
MPIERGQLGVIVRSEALPSATMALDDYRTTKAIEALALALTGTLPGLIAAARLAAAAGVELPELKEKLLDAWEKRLTHRAENISGIQPEEAEHLARAMEHIARMR